MIEETARGTLKRQKYALFGRNSSAKLCHWTKKSIYNEGVCYKEAFYGIACHRCVQMTPATDACTHNCVFCWRAGDFSKIEVRDPDEPRAIVAGALNAQKLLVSGFGGEEKADKTKWREALAPKHAAISLSGEPFCYPLMGELVAEFHRAGLTTFIVSNGTIPERIAALTALPTQFYLSLVAPDEETYAKVCAPLVSEGWKKFNESLELMASMRGRTVLRMTAIKGLNMHGEREYSKRILKAQPKYVEVKSYMHRGSSIRRLTPEHMPTHAEVAEFAAKVAAQTGYAVCAESAPSRVVLLARDDTAAAQRVMRFE